MKLEEAMRFGTGSAAKAQHDYGKLEKEAAELLLECSRLRRENMRMKRQLQAVRQAVGLNAEEG